MSDGAATSDSEEVHPAHHQAHELAGEDVVLAVLQAARDALGARRRPARLRAELFDAALRRGERFVAVLRGRQRDQKNTDGRCSSDSRRAVTQSTICC